MITHRANYFGLLAGTATCWSCKAETPVVAIVLNQWQELSEDDDDEDLPGDSPAKLTYIIGLNPEALSTYQQAAPNVRFMASGGTGQSFWANVCVHCEALQGDWYLHGSEGPFFPQAPAQEATLALTWHETMLEASASYSQSGWLDGFVARNSRQ